MCDVWNDPSALKRELSLENICIIRDKPPLLEDDGDNEEYKYLFGGDQPISSEPYNNVDPAVFNEISDMLNLVKESNEDALPESSGNGEIEENDPMVISKLNPDVPEFQPQTQNISSESTTSTGLTTEVQLTQENGETPKAHSIESIEDEKKSNVIVEEKNNDIDDKHNSYVIEEMKSTLTKVLSEAKSSCIKKKRMRNVAIANLIKLKSMNTTESVVNTIKLMKPSDFIAQADVLELPATSLNTHNVLENKCSDVETKKSEKIVDIHQNKVDGDPVLQLEVNNSIRKVERWLGNDEPMETDTSPRLKTSKNGLSYTVVKTHSPKTNSPVPAEPVKLKKFVPSANSNVYMKYVKNAKEISNRKEDVWSKVVNDMKELDKKKLKEMEQNFANIDL